MHIIIIIYQKCDGLKQPEYKKMCVDPQITSFSILQCLLIRAFNIKSDFTISYLATDDDGSDVYLSMLSDWDLDAAIFSSSTPYLCLKVDLKPYESGIDDDWDVIKSPDSIPPSSSSSSLSTTSSSSTTTMIFTLPTTTTVINANKVFSKTLNNFFEKTYNNHLHLPPLSSPLSDGDFRSFQSPVGVLIEQNKFRLAGVYQGGVECSLRKVVWRHLLNVYPHDMTGKERIDYLNTKSKDYYKLRDGWKRKLMDGLMSGEDRQVICAVKKDVLRTDRHHPYFSGKDDNQNSISLLNLLVTYALTHPSTSYCQGMSDLASPLLVVQKDEPTAYICFCSLMDRLRGNFAPDGELIMGKFEHLSLLLDHHDWEFAQHLRKHRIGPDLFFCYRWILLEMKREFPLDDAMLVLEIMWSTLPIREPHSVSGVPLVDEDFVVLSTSPGSLSSPAYRYFTSYLNLKNRCREERKSSVGPATRSLPFTAATAVATSATTTTTTSSNHHRHHRNRQSSSPPSSLSLLKSLSSRLSSSPLQPTTSSSAAITATTATTTSAATTASSSSNSNNNGHLNNNISNNNKSPQSLSPLPPPDEIGHGNSFLMFLCLSLLLTHRDHIMSAMLDFNDTAIFYDRKVRKHNAVNVIVHAKSLYSAYLKNQMYLSRSRRD
ncbi:hypothetical protein HELRODRAFT_87093 [Helobdella robusta]|uniref:Rab-GAP TBC domain-containing protein n=1 Tax=Helobdella robusta TaxID=6412 RepID=T1G6L5_HELRO|nr:hypothetical protein HELRODRAFT_87093 [Helobdella robusta]ESN95106.1 hypothetical protein HELRODRAFT_87093 [Helobdella robusta]